MKICTRYGTIPPIQAGEAGLHQLRYDIEHLCTNMTPLRFSVTRMARDSWDCEIECIENMNEAILPPLPSIFSFRKRLFERTHCFTAVMLVPTGIDCAIGGHAGDATPAARLLASVCDHLILHPNVVNASDINEQAENCLYVEGSLICRLLLGAISLRKVRSNRILMITEKCEDSLLALDVVINTANAAQATLGVHCTKIIMLQPHLSMTISFSPSGRAVGEICDFDSLISLLRREQGNYDAVALSTSMTVPFMDMKELCKSYYLSDAANPWGGSEAMLTHMVSTVFNVPSAHAPLVEDAVLNADSYGLTDPRKAAEVISSGFLFCLLKGLQRAPSVVPHPDSAYDPALLAVEDISCLVIPDGCVGLPTLAALFQGIPVIAVRNNTNCMKNSLEQLPFQEGQLWIVDNYFEAAGLVAALKIGLHPPSVTRPLLSIPITEL